MRAGGRIGAVAFAVAAAALAVLALDRRAPSPAADVWLGGEDAFAAGLYPRELPPGGRPLRWTHAEARFRFGNLPRGPATLGVRVRGHRGPVRVAADGVVLGTLAVGETEGRWTLPATERRARTVGLVALPFEAGGRSLGTQLVRVELEHARGGWPAPGLWLAFLVPALAVAACAAASGWRWWPAAGAAVLVAAAEAALLWPRGVLRSGYASTLAVLLVVGVVASLAAARVLERRERGSGRWAFAAGVVALLVQGALATSPVMVVSDAVFHANNLARVAQGNWFLTSVTQHEPPVRFPYGVAFYAPLVPLWRAGLDGVWLVRGAAGVAGLVGSGALFLLARPAGAPVAALAVVLWQLLPGVLDVHSFGNLSNVFGQAATMAFAAWWLRGRRWGVGALLYAAGCLAHFSSLAVLLMLAASLAAFDRGRPDAARRWAALAAGLGAAGAYYLHFLPLMLDQLPLLAAEGGAAAGGAWEGVVRQVEAVARQWGWPVLLLALAVRMPAEAVPLADVLRAWAAAASAAMVLAAVSPVEVRYLYAAGPALAVAAATATAWTWDRGGPVRAAGCALLAAQAALAASNALEALLLRYRP